MILIQTPLRVSLFGGGTDYPTWYQEEDGLVLGMAIDKYCYVGVKPMPPGQEIAPGVTLRYRVQYSKVDNCVDLDGIRHPAVKAALQSLAIDTPLEFNCFSDMPGRAGLGGSSTFTVSVLHALRRMFNKPYSKGAEPFNPTLLATEASTIEREVIRETVGDQDQLFAAYGGFRIIGFSKNGHRVDPLRVEPSMIEQLAKSLVLVYSGIMRDAHVMAAKQVEQIPSSKDVMQSMVEQAKEGIRIMHDQTKRLDGIGSLLTSAWLSKKILCPEVTNYEIDSLFERGLDCGAAGGKLLGAGGGGFMLFFVAPKKQEAFKRSIGAPCVSFNVSRHGSRVVPLDYPKEDL